MSSKSSSFSILDFDDDDMAGVDGWESTGIISAAEADEAERNATEIKLKLDEEEKNCAKLAESAKKHLEDMASLLKKVELTTATKEEMKRLSMLDEEIKRLKEGISGSKSAIKSYSEEMVKSMSKTKTYALMKASKERDIQSVVDFVSQAETVDLAFLLDCTASMSSYIEAAKSSMKDVVKLVQRTNAGLKLRVAVVGYRDLCDTKQFEVMDFTEYVADFESFVSNLVADGGGDPPEDIAGAIQKARELTWKQVSRVTFLITDAPCHGNQYHTFIDGDNYPTGTPGICIEAELKKLMDQGGETGMQLQFGRIKSNTDQMIRVFGEKGVEFDVCDLKDPKKLSSAVSSGVRKSISKSVTASMSERSSFIESFEEVREIKQYAIREAKPSLDEWNAIKPCTVNVFCNKPISSVDDLKAPLSFGLIRWGKPSSATTEEKKMIMRLAKDPFAEGEMRLAYYAKMGREDSGAATAATAGEKVLKSFKKTRKSSSSERKHYLAQMEVSTIAQFLAEEYNKSFRPSHCPEIKFLPVYVVETENTTVVERYCAEDQLPCAATSFTKYSNNNGYWNEDEINQSLLLFTRFSHEKTGGYMMVTDLQGVRRGNEYILTDPAILCKDKTRFGRTNLGGKFIEKCMKTTQQMLEEHGWEGWEGDV